jgi:hypothetical protein
MSPSTSSRRAFVRRMAYAAPTVLTLAAAPEFAKAGSGKWDAGGGRGPDRGRGGPWGDDPPGRRRGPWGAQTPGRSRGHGHE